MSLEFVHKGLHGENVPAASAERERDAVFCSRVHCFLAVSAETSLSLRSHTGAGIMTSLSVSKSGLLGKHCFRGHCSLQRLPVRKIVRCYLHVFGGRCRASCDCSPPQQRSSQLPALVKQCCFSYYGIRLAVHEASMRWYLLAERTGVQHGPLSG